MSSGDNGGTSELRAIDMRLVRFPKKYPIVDLAPAFDDRAGYAPRVFAGGSKNPNFNSRQGIRPANLRVIAKTDYAPVVDVVNFKTLPTIGGFLRNSLGTIESAALRQQSYIGIYHLLNHRTPF